MNLRERMTHNYLTNHSWIVHTVTKPSKFQSHDIFGLYDHIAICDDINSITGDIIPPGESVYVQTKSIKQYGQAILKYSTFPAEYKYIFVWNAIKINKKTDYVLMIQKL